MNSRPSCKTRGFAMIEVLVTLLVLLIGLLGMFGLMSRGAVLEMESYQRSQALTLLREMESRLRINAALFDAGFRTGFAAAANPAVFGQGSTVACPSPATIHRSPRWTMPASGASACRAARCAPAAPAAPSAARWWARAAA